MYLTHLTCTDCETHADHRDLQTVCSVCSRPLAAAYDLDQVAANTKRSDIATRSRGMSRWREVLPVGATEEFVTLGEGDTPLLEAPRLSRQLELDHVLVKDEALNPTGSFKARGMAAAVSMAKARGAKALAAPSAGNAGGALAAYGARAGLPVHLAMPRDVPSANRFEARLFGAEVELIDGTIADCGKWIGERARTNGWFDLSTLKEPYRVEGKKTMGYELAEQLGWKLPDVILYPTGGGTGLVGMWKAFAEMRTLGWLAAEARLPRMVVVQATGCAPMVEAFAARSEDAKPPANPTTVASGLRVPSPIGDHWMTRVLNESDGTALSVSDDELLAGAHTLATTEGICAAPEAGALVAALERLKAQNWLNPSDSVVLFNTGSGLKYSECL